LELKVVIRDLAAKFGRRKMSVEVDEDVLKEGIYPDDEKKKT
jgi:hypothetical protein